MTDPKPVAAANAPRMPSLLRDALLCAWFLLVALAFWSPALGIADALPANTLTALYAIFLVATIVLVVLRAVKSGRDGGAPADVTATAPIAATEASDGR